MQKVVTRFAPSPTGVLHTGSARTALFNYLFARHHGGQFMLRIEDTDLERSKPEHVEAIQRNLEWLGLDHDGEIVYQMRRAHRHAEVAHQLVEKGAAYYCYSSPAEIEAFRHNNPFAKFISPWREPKETPPVGVKPVVRLKVKKEGSTTITDLIQGEITVAHEELDDMIMLRSDGVPTYMLAVVVDDHDMGITHIIRGDDHLTNAFRQKQIYDAMGWEVPQFAHIPLIHDKSGRKLSKREGALGIDTYEELGYLPEAVINHLLRLGWSHGDTEIITLQEAVKLFSLEAVGKSPARFDMDKLNFINAHYMRSMANSELFGLLKDRLERLPDEILNRIEKGLDGIKQRSSTLVELAENAQIYVSKRAELDEKSTEILSKVESGLLAAIKAKIVSQSDYSKDALHHAFEALATEHNVKFPVIMQTLRAILLGTFAAPGVFEVMEVLGKEECVKRCFDQSSRKEGDNKSEISAKSAKMSMDA